MIDDSVNEKTRWMSLSILKETLLSTHRSNDMCKQFNLGNFFSDFNVSD